MSITYLQDSSRRPSSSMVKASSEPPNAPKSSTIISRDSQVVVQRQGADDAIGTRGVTVPVPGTGPGYAGQVPAPAAPPAPVLVTPPAPPAPVSVHRQKVRLSNQGMGKLTVFVDGFAVSDSLIILAYREDGSSTIVEPPQCGLDNPVFVEHQGQTYPCIFGGWTAELDGRLLVVLARIVQ
jgi:hypothetical protein